MDIKRIQDISDSLVNIYLAIESEILDNIAELIKEGKPLMEKDMATWQTEQLQKLGALTQSNIIAIAKRSGKAIDEISKMLEQVGYTAMNETDKNLAEIVRQGLLIEPPDKTRQDTLLRVLSAFDQQLKNKLANANKTMLQGANQAYTDVINKTMAKYTAGLKNPYQAISEVVHEWSKGSSNGINIPALIDSKGRQWSTEAYLLQVARSTNNDVITNIQFGRMDDYGVDLMLISSHLGARPLCYPYQGKIYSRSGNSKKYPPFSSTSYGEKAGLFGINCGHYPIPYVEGMNTNNMPKYGKEENDKEYKEKQKQRYLEREVRKAKKELKLMEAIGDKESIERAKQEVRDRQSAIRIFVAETDRKRDYGREAIYSIR